MLELLFSVGLNKVVELFNEPDKIVEVVSQNPIEAAVTLLGTALVGFLTKKLPDKRHKMVYGLRCIIHALEWVMEIAPKALRICREWMQELEKKVPRKNK